MVRIVSLCSIHTQIELGGCVQTFEVEYYASKDTVGSNCSCYKRSIAMPVVKCTLQYCKVECCCTCSEPLLNGELRHSFENNNLTVRLKSQRSGLNKRSTNPIRIKSIIGWKVVIVYYVQHPTEIVAPFIQSYQLQYWIYGRCCGGSGAWNTIGVI